MSGVDTARRRRAAIPAAWALAALAAVAGCERRDAAGPTAAPTEPGSIITNSIGMKLAYVPAGSFVMGSPADEPGRHGDEARRDVTITRGFYLGVTEVTQAQWQRVMGFNPSEPKGDELPVVRVSWAHAAAFCRKLTDAEKRTYRLPTEAEWEYACRAGAPGAFAGTGRLDEMGWHIDNSDETLRPVARKQPNAWGLHDMHGNAMEWCADWYARQTPAGPASDPAGPAEGKERVARGGSWGHFPRACRSAARASVRPAYQLKQVGFRVLLVEAKPTPP